MWNARTHCALIFAITSLLGGCTLAQKPADSTLLRIPIPSSLAKTYSKAPASRLGHSLTAPAPETTLRFILTIDGPGIPKGSMAQNFGCLHATDSTSFFLEPAMGDQSFDVLVPAGADRTVRLFMVDFASLPALPSNGQAFLDFFRQQMANGTFSQFFDDPAPNPLKIAESRIANLSGDQTVDLYMDPVGTEVCGDPGQGNGPNGPAPPPPLTDSGQNLELSDYHPWHGEDPNGVPNPLFYWRTNEVNAPIYLRLGGILTKSATTDSVKIFYSGGSLTGTPSPAVSLTSQVFMNTNQRYGVDFVLNSTQPSAQFGQNFEISMSSTPIGSTQDFDLEHHLTFIETTNSTPSGTLTLSRPLKASVIAAPIVGPPVTLGRANPTAISNLYEFPVTFTREGWFNAYKKEGAFSRHLALGINGSAELLAIPEPQDGGIYEARTLMSGASPLVTSPVAFAVAPNGSHGFASAFAFVDGDGKLVLQFGDSIRMNRADVRDALYTPGPTVVANTTGTLSSLAFSQDGNKLYIASLDSNTTPSYHGSVQVMNLASVTPIQDGTLPAPSVILAGDKPGQFRQETHSVFSPAGLVEIDGSLYISDFRNHVIYSYTTSDGTLNLFAGSWNPGAASTSPVLLTSASFNVPRGLSGFLENNSPRILVADTGNQAIRLIGTPNSPKSKVSTLIPGAPNLVSPYMAVKGKDGYFYIADAGDNHIKRVTPFTNRLTVISGENSTPGSSDGIGSLNTSHSQPKALGVLPGGDLLVMDQGTSNNGGIRKIARLPACPNENSVNGQMHLLQNESCAMAFTVLGSGNELNSGTDTVVADLEIRSDNPNSNSMTTARYQQALASETFYNSTTNVASFSLNNQWNDLTPLLISLYLGFTPPAGAPDPLLLQARIQTLDGQWDSNPKSHLTFSGTGFIVDRLVKTQPVTFIEVVFLVQSPTSGPTILRRTYNLSPFPQ